MKSESERSQTKKILYNEHKFLQIRDTNANSYIKRCSTFIKGMQTKTTMRYHLTVIRMATILKKSKIYQVLARLWRNWNPCTLLVGMQNSVASLENSMEVPQKIKNRTIIRFSNLISGYLSKGNEVRISKRY